MPTIHHQIAIVGGGTAGITVAARLAKGRRKRLDIAVLEPSDKHYYQPFWTLVGAGIASKTCRRRKPERQFASKRRCWYVTCTSRSTARFRTLTTMDTPRARSSPDTVNWFWPNSTTRSSPERRFRSINRASAGACGCSSDTCCRFCIGTACSRAEPESHLPTFNQSRYGKHHDASFLR